jgi:hypothetical protein
MSRFGGGVQSGALAQRRTATSIMFLTWSRHERRADLVARNSFEQYGRTVAGPVREEKPECDSEKASVTYELHTYDKK